MPGVFNLDLQSVLESLELTKGVDPVLLHLLTDLQDFCCQPLIVHLLISKDHSNPRSQHRLGRAADFHIEGTKLVDQFLCAIRFPFTGVGIYTSFVWNNPGLHADVRSLPNGSPRALWSCNKRNVYGRIDAKFLTLASIAEKIQA